MIYTFRKTVTCRHTYSCEIDAASPEEARQRVGIDTGKWTRSAEDTERQETLVDFFTDENHNVHSRCKLGLLQELRKIEDAETEEARRLRELYEVED